MNISRNPLEVTPEEAGFEQCVLKQKGELFDLYRGASVCSREEDLHIRFDLRGEDGECLDVRWYHYPDEMLDQRDMLIEEILDDSSEAGCVVDGGYESDTSSEEILHAGAHQERIEDSSSTEYVTAKEFSSADSSSEEAVDYTDRVDLI